MPYSYFMGPSRLPDANWRTMGSSVESNSFTVPSQTTWPCRLVSKQLKFQAHGKQICSDSTPPHRSTGDAEDICSRHQRPVHLQIHHGPTCFRPTAQSNDLRLPVNKPRSSNNRYLLPFRRWIKDCKPVGIPAPYGKKTGSWWQGGNVKTYHSTNRCHFTQPFDTKALA